MFNSKWKYEKLAVPSTFRRRRRTWLFHAVVLQRTAMKCTKLYNARAQRLCCSLNRFFSDVLVAVVVVACLSSLLSHTLRVYQSYSASRSKKVSHGILSYLATSKITLKWKGTLKIVIIVKIVIGFALKLVLKQRHKRTRKWPIVYQRRQCREGETRVVWPRGFMTSTEFREKNRLPVV